LSRSAGWNLVLSLPVILVIAWLAGRLLGVSRSWAGTVLAGVAGRLAKPGALARAQRGLVSVPTRCGRSAAPAGGEPRWWPRRCCSA
jgi:hypothetical protein